MFCGSAFWGSVFCSELFGLFKPLPGDKADGSFGALLLAVDRRVFSNASELSGLVESDALGAFAAVLFAIGFGGGEAERSPSNAGALASAVRLVLGAPSPGKGAGFRSLGFVALGLEAPEPAGEGRPPKAGGVDGDLAIDDELIPPGEGKA